MKTKVRSIKIVTVLILFSCLPSFNASAGETLYLGIDSETGKNFPCSIRVTDYRLETDSRAVNAPEQNISNQFRNLDVVVTFDSRRFNKDMYRILEIYQIPYVINAGTTAVTVKDIKNSVAMVPRNPFEPVKEGYYDSIDDDYTILSVLKSSGQIFENKKGKWIQSFGSRVSFKKSSESIVFFELYPMNDPLLHRSNGRLVWSDALNGSKRNSVYCYVNPTKN